MDPARVPHGVLSAVISRRALLGAGAGSLLAARRPRAAPPPVAVGAIRWDAWQATGSVPNAAVARSLSPPRWRHRLPFFAQVGPDGAVAIEGGTQAAMDREITLARRAGLSFWAFVSYPPGSAMSAGLRLFLSSRQRAGLRFCLIAELRPWDTSPAWTEWQLELLAHPDHQRTPEGRPLFFLGFLSDALIAERWGGTAGLRAALDRFRARAVAAGAGNPCLVLTGRPRTTTRLAAALEADAVGAYDLAGEGAGAPYAALARQAEAAWEAQATAGLPVVPTAMAGWDRRPRIEAPVPWEPWQRPGEGIERHYAAPTPAELAAHVARAADRAAAERRPGAPRAALVYAWNENDEGGWLVPTLPFDDARITALRRALCAPGRAVRVEGCG